MMKITILILVSLIVSPIWAKKYAVIVNGGDDGKSGANVGQDGTLLRNHFTEMANLEANFYRSQGYEVIMVDANQGANAANFTSIVRSLKDAAELAIGIFAHGLLVNGKAQISSTSHTGSRTRFPKGHVRPDEFESRIGYSLQDNSNHFAYFLAAREKKPGEKKDPSSDRMGLGDLYDALAVAKMNNPSMVTSINSLSCFGGNAIRALESIPDTQIFSATDTTSPSYMLFDGPLSSPTTTLVNYSQFLIQAQSQGLSYLDAHLVAKKSYDDYALWKAMGITTARPQNSIEMHFADMCLGAPAATELNACSFEEIVPQGLMNLTRSVVQTQLHKFMSASLSEERRFWQGTKANSCSDTFAETPVPSELMQAFRQEIGKYLNALEASGVPGIIHYRKAVDNWECPTLIDCNVGEIASRIQPEESSITFPIPNSNVAYWLLQKNCSGFRAANIPDSRQAQLNCVFTYGKKEPLAALAMLRELLEKNANLNGFCDKAQAGLEKVTQLEQCLKTVSSRGDSDFWKRMSNLLSIGNSNP